MTDNSTEATPRFPLKFFTSRPNYHWYVVATVCIGAFMAALDGSIITVALPTIDREFNVNVSESAWVALAYLLTLTALLAMFGRIADIVGRRPLYTIGFSIFIIGSALCGASPTLSLLIGFRVLQGIGATMLQANSVAIVTAAVPQKVRGKAIGIQGSALAVGLSLGPAIGGLLIGFFGWRSIFYVNVPVGIIGTALAAMILPIDLHKDASAKSNFDFLGAFLLAVSLIAFLLGLNQGNDDGWGSPIIIGYFVATVLFAVLFYFQEKRHTSPLIDLGLFKIEQLTWGNITGSLSYGVMYGVLYIVPYFFEDVLHKPSSASGLLTTPLPIGMMLLAPVAGKIADKFGSKLPTVTGMGIATLGTIALIFVDDKTNLLFIIIALFFVGVGMGVFTPPNNSSVMGSTPPNRLGVSSGMLNMSRSLGQSVGIAYAFAIFQGVILIYHFTPKNAPVGPLIAGFKWTFIGVAIFGAVALFISLFRGNVEKVALPEEAHIIEL
ncbi:MFS transporter [Sulfoacidibacillus ferrooxidans]|nr:MFS transporter [Sulfoacidibacillus ferrooxidans]